MSADSDYLNDVQEGLMNAIDQHKTTTCDTFYDEFRDALKYLGPGWAGKDKIKIVVVDNKIVMSYEAVAVTIDVNYGV